MSREEKIRLLNQLNGAQTNMGVSLTSSKKSGGTMKGKRPTSALSSKGSQFGTPARNPNAKKMRPQSAAQISLPKPAFNNFVAPPPQQKPGPKQGANQMLNTIKKSLIHLVNA
jgi:hypothetical protein